MKRKLWILVVLIPMMVCLCPVSWVAYKLSFGWTRAGLDEFVNASVLPRSSKEEVKTWCLAQGWEVNETKDNLTGESQGHKSIPEWASVDPSAVVWAVRAFIPKNEVRGIHLIGWTQLIVYFFFDEQGRLLKSHAHQYDWGP